MYMKPEYLNKFTHIRNENLKKVNCLSINSNLIKRIKIN